MSIRAALALVTLGLSVASIACTVEDPTAGDEADLKLSSGYRYECYRTVNPTTKWHVSVALKSKGSLLSQVWRFDDGRTRVADYQLDPSYAPKTNTAYARFNHVDGEGSDDEILVLEPMRTGAAKGSIKLQSGGDSFSSLYFHCSRTTKVINTGEPARKAATDAVWSKLHSNYYGDPPASQTPEEAAETVYSLFLSQDGTYYAVNADARTETGVWTADGSSEPISLSLQSGSFPWTATAKGGKLTWVRGALTKTLTAP